VKRKNSGKGLIFVLSGPSGSGKTTLLTRLVGDPAFKGRLVKSISVTTRPKRRKEKEGVDYFFLKSGQFRRQRKAEKILEYTRYLGYYYATPKDFLEQTLKRGKSIILSLDLKGAARLKKLYPGNAVTIFILPPSIKALRRRIEKRSPETKRDEVSNRLKLAEKEILASRHYDHCLVNKELDRSVNRLKKIVLSEIERHK